MVINDDFYMSLAINKAWEFQGLTYPNPAVGCLILDEFGKILSIQAHQKAGFAHAELNAVKSALESLNPNLKLPDEPNSLYKTILENHNNLLKNSTFYVTLEPCSHQGKTPPCAMLLKELKPKKVLIGIKDLHSSGGIEILKNAGICVKTGICEEASKELIEPFLKWKSSNFTFFKLALSINGSIEGSITSTESKAYCHGLRDKITKLIIGGSTIRKDRPTLDSRLINGKAPDVLIYSRSQEFDQTIPLFSVANRKVCIKNSLDISNFNMIEGGYNMLELCKDKVDWYLIFHSSNFQTEENIKSNLKLKCLWQSKNKNDTFSWYKSL